MQLNKANPNAAVLQLKALEAFQKAADGKATKIIIPSEIQGLAGLAAGLKGIVESDQPTESSETVSQVAKNGTTIFRQEEAASSRLFLLKKVKFPKERKVVNGYLQTNFICCIIKK